jgi:hypothetical protein
MSRRDQRGRVLRAIEGAVRQFRTRKELWPLRVPAEPLVLDAIVRRALGDEISRFDTKTLRSRSLLSLAWDDGSRWELWTLTLDSGVRLYCDTSQDESRILASARRDSEIDPDRLFLELLSESGGEMFGIGLEGGPPSRVRSTIDDRQMLVDFFVNLFEVSGMEEEIRADALRSEDFRTDVQRWLEDVAAL